MYLPNPDVLYSQVASWAVTLANERRFCLLTIMAIPFFSHSFIIVSLIPAEKCLPSTRSYILNLTMNIYVNYTNFSFDRKPIY